MVVLAGGHAVLGRKRLEWNPGSNRLRAEDESEFPVMLRPAPLAVEAEAKL